MRADKNDPRWEEAIMRRVRAVVGMFVSILVLATLAPGTARAEEPDEGVWRNYDFVPGAKVWFVSDFTDEPVGRFPAGQLEFVRGNAQIVELDGEKLLECTANSVFRVILREELPEDFTIEFTIKTGTPNMATRVFFTPIEGSFSKLESQYLNLDRRPGIYLKGQEVSTANRTRGLADEFVSVKLQHDGDYAIVYLGTERISNVPNAKFLLSTTIEFQVSANPRFPSYVKDIVVAVGLDDLYDKLVETGEFTTRGIFFAFDSAALGGESTPVLERIRSTMEEHPELNIVVEGHTDSVGDEEYNQELSERRAQAVVRYLEEHEIDGERMTAQGKGEAEPVADNDTPEGRAENRRVVLRVAPKT